MELRKLLTDYADEVQSARPKGKLTASGLHTVCRRQQAFGLHDTPKTDKVESVTAALVGTALHEVYATRWRQIDPDALVEERSEHGQADVVHIRKDGVKVVRDLKTKHKRGYNEWVARGVGDAAWDQLKVYGYDHGLKDDDLLVIDLWDRQNGDIAEFTYSYSVKEGEEAVDRLHAIEDSILSAPPERAPTGERSGDGDYFCDRCAWRSACLDWSGEPKDVEVCA